MAERSNTSNTAAVPVWNVETLRAHIEALLESFDKRMSERHEAADKAIALAFDAQKDAIQAAFMSQKEALSTAFQAQKESELASDKRFESVNEFRSTLADQQRMLMPRTEAEALLRALKDKLETTTITLAEKIDAISKLETARVGLGQGVKYGWQYSVAIIGLILTVLGIVSWMKAHN
jgi:hypothetical protein